MREKYNRVSSVEKLYQSELLSDHRVKLQKRFIIHAIREAVKSFKLSSLMTGAVDNLDNLIIESAKAKLDRLVSHSLKRVINATGVILNTNIGRAPLSKVMISHLFEIAQGYCNLELDLVSGERGSRQDHISDKINFITGSEGALVVNNNAAAIVLALNTLCLGKEVLVSRGELIEIGDSFRIHEIIESSGSILVEVGSTNKTTLADYKKAISSKTGAILKVHRSNFSMNGFTQEVKIEEIIKEFSRGKKVPIIYDLGSGLMDNSLFVGLENEPDVLSAVKSECDIVTFSCDKLLGGAQAGIIAGKEKLLHKMRKNPLNRALRPCKLTISMLSSLFISYLYLEQKIPLIDLANTRKSALKQRAENLADKISQFGIICEVVDSIGKFGGGTLPEYNIDSYSVEIKKLPLDISSKHFFKYLLNNKDISVLPNLKKGRVSLDVLAIDDSEIICLCDVIGMIISKEVESRG